MVVFAVVVRLASLLLVVWGWDLRGTGVLRGHFDGGNGTTDVGAAERACAGAVARIDEGAVEVVAAACCEVCR